MRRNGCRKMSRVEKEVPKSPFLAIRDRGSGISDQRAGSGEQGAGSDQQSGSSERMDVPRGTKRFVALEVVSVPRGTLHPPPCSRGAPESERSENREWGVNSSGSQGCSTWNNRANAYGSPAPRSPDGRLSQESQSPGDDQRAAAWPSFKISWREPGRGWASAQRMPGSFSRADSVA